MNSSENSMVSIIIPSRSEEYLNNTVNDLLKRAEGEIEIIVTLDGPPVEEPPVDPRVRYLRNEAPLGMRHAINQAAKEATGKYLMKCDAHCAFDQGFDVKLKADCEPDWTVVPRRYAIDKNNWGKHPNPDYYNDFQYIGHPKLESGYRFKGIEWPEYGVRVKDQEICDLMTSQGSCWFMFRERFWELEGLDEVNYGSMGAEAQEICLKSWLSGGRYVLNRKTWYAHKKKRVGKHKNDRGYSKPNDEWKKSRSFAIKCWTHNEWPEQTRKLEWLVEKFKPVPGWHIKMEAVNTNRFIQERFKLNYAIDRYPKVIKGFNRDGLVKLWKELGYKVGCEVGVEAGTFANIMFNGIPGLKLYLVDPYIDYSGEKRRGNNHLRFEESARKVMEGRDAVLFKELSETAFLKIPDGSLDFVYIDGNHRYDYVMLDIILWQRKVRPGGMISGHDYKTLKRPDKRQIEFAVDDYVGFHNIAPWYLTDDTAVRYKADRHASFFWIKQ